MAFFSGFESTLTYAILVVILVVTTFTFIAILYLNNIAPQPIKRLAPGSFGFPIIGETVSILRAVRHNEVHEWVDDHIRKFGPIFKTSILGSKTVFLTGQAANKFILDFSTKGLSATKYTTMVKLFGNNSIFLLSGSKHKLVRSVLTSLFHPESIQKYVTQIDLMVEERLFQDLHCKDSIKMVPFMKKMSFSISCILLFGISKVNEIDALYEDIEIFLVGTSSVPISFPGSRFHKAQQARGRLNKKLSDVIRRTKDEIENGKLGHYKTVISCFLHLRDENGDHYTEEAIIDNLVSVIFASHDTIAVLMCAFIRKLARSSEVYDKVLEEQKEVLKACKERDGKLTWNEIKMMKYTWTVAQELMRLSPPAIGNSRFVENDTSFSGFDIPKGWHVFWLSSPTHMDKDIFENPETFDPARFESQSKLAIPPYTYIPFGGGHRICPGSEFARIEVLLIVHHLVTNYSWTEMITDEPIRCAPIAFPAMGLPVKLNHKQASLV